MAAGFWTTCRHSKYAIQLNSEAKIVIVRLTFNFQKIHFCELGFLDIWMPILFIYLDYTTWSCVCPCIKTVVQSCWTTITSRLTSPNCHSILGQDWFCSPWFSIALSRQWRVLTASNWQLSFNSARWIIVLVIFNPCLSNSCSHLFLCQMLVNISELYPIDFT